MQAIGWQPNPPIRAPDGAPVHYERLRPEQTTLYRLVQQHAATFFAQTEEATGASLPQFIEDEFDAFLECGILAHGFLRPPLCLLLAAQPKLVTPVLKVVQRAPRACRRWSSCSAWLRWCPDPGCT